VSDPRTSLDPQAGGTGDLESHRDLLDELHRHKEEILRLRDLLIGKNAELGAIKARIAQLEAERRNHPKFIAWLRMRVPSRVRRKLRLLRNPNR
jgi:hypothetical protein